MRAIRMIVAALFVVTAALFAANGIYERASCRDQGPVLRCGEEILEISVRDDKAALLEGVTAEDGQDGDLTGEILVGGVSRLTGGDTAKVTYLVFDSDDNMASLVRQVRYTDYRRPVIRVTQPLVFADPDEAELLEYVTVTDVIDGDLSDHARVSTLWTTEHERVYSATVQVTNSMGDIASVELPVIIRSDDGAGIQLREQVAYMERDGEFDPMDYVDGPKSGLKVLNEVDASQPGCYWVWYFDGSDGENFAILTVVVE